ncbi:MAG: thiamine pyrophosphate-binding protein [Pirellulales bacterium]
MTQFHGGRLAARALKNAGVECLFTLCGGHVMPIYDGCLDEGINIVDVRHEQAATHAADAWARVNPGKIGVAVVTAGPGVTDCVTGVANAWRANSPILVFGGQGPLINLRRGSLQEMDHVNLMKPITKWADACYQTERIPEYIETAIKHAISGSPGPVYLEIPMDVLMNVGELDRRWDRPIRTVPPAIMPDRGSVLEALEILQCAERPMLMAGTSVKWSNGQTQLHKFLEKTNIPAYTNGMGRGTLPRDSQHLFNRTRREATEECDVLVLAGTILDFRMKFGKNIPADAKIVQLDMDYSIIGQNRPCDVALVGNLARTFEMLLQSMEDEAIHLDFSAHSARLREREELMEKELAERYLSDEVPIDSLRLCKEIANAVTDDMIVIGDGGDIVAQASKVVPIPRNGFWMDPGPLGTLGVGMPFAIAGQIAHPDKRVMIIYGDGSFGLNGFEYDTAIRFNLPIVGIVGNDAAWGQMMRPQAAAFGEARLVATKLAYTRYDKVVEALGGHGEYVTDPKEIQPAIQRAFDSGKPACVNVEIKQDLTYQGGSYI